MNKEEARKIAVNLLMTIFENDMKAIATVVTAQADDNWEPVKEALDTLAKFAIKLKDNIA